MAKKYVVAIMNRLSLEDGNFIYYVSHPAIGEIDDETGIFTDKNGREYLSMLEESLQISEVSTAYFRPIPLENIKNQMNVASTKEAISEYDFQMSNNIYFVSATPSAGAFCIPININEMKAGIEGCMQEYNNQMENNGNEENSNGTSDESIGDYAVSSSEVRADIAALLLEITEGVYSLEELKQIRDSIIAQQEDIECLVDSLELQIEASEKGESSIRLKGEKDHPTRLREEKKEEEPTKEEKRVKIKNHLDLQKIFESITRTLIAQDEPTRRVLVEIARKEQSPQSKNRAILITGQSGSGKTKMMQLVAKYIDRPFFKVDSTQLTIPGYVGRDIEEVLWDLYVACGKDKEKAEHAIIYFDEIDKKGSSRKDDVSGRGVLNVLLPFIEGSTYEATESLRTKGETVKIDTSNMIIILGGAFTDVYKNLQTKNEIGFGTTPQEKKTKQATTEDFVTKAKMPDEFMGRVSIVKLNDLDLQAIRRILLESDESAIKIQQRLFEELGVRLTVGEDYIDAIAEEAEKKKTGARGLNTAVDETTWEAYGDAYTHLGEYDEMILGKETVENPKKYKKVYKK